MNYQRSLNWPGTDLTAYTEYKHYPVHMERLHWLVKQINQRRKNDGSTVRILDVGCGTGNITIPLGTIENSVVVGIDMYQPNIDLVNSRNTFSNVSVTFSRLGDFDVAPFDFIIFTEVLEHIPGYKEILRDLAARMKADAIVLITIPNGRGPFEMAMKPLYLMRKLGLNGFIGKVKKLLGKKEPYALNQEIDPHVNFFTRRQIETDAHELEFELSTIEKAFVFSPILETYTPFISLHRIAHADNRLAQRLPLWCASGWYYSLRKKG
ncbi:MAG: class I SAM-dependent methyltransferase [Flavobacteriales bacterium]